MTTCVRCEIVRAKAIAIGMGGLRKPLQDILAALQSRYGPAYQLNGRRIERNTAEGVVVIYEVRR